MERNKVILIIDDDQDDRALFSDAVAHVDHSIVCMHANDGIEGVEILKNGDKTPPDYIFLDLNLPRLSGVQCLVEIKNDPRLVHVPVIIYSTSKRSEDIAETKRLGAAHFVTKPVLFNDICNAITYVIDTNWGNSFSA